MDIIEILRFANMALSMTGISLLVTSVMYRWREYSPRIRRIVMPLIAILIVWCYGTGEQLVQHTEGGARVPMATISLIWLNIAIMWGFVSEHSDYSPRR